MNVLRDPILLLLVALALGWGVFAGSGAPPPRAADAPPDVFSAGRAEPMLEDLYRGLGPHVSGSPANAELRDRIVARLRAAGYAVDLQRRYHCNPMFAACSPVENIIALREGTDEKHQAILLTAHYDSTWGGPGVADDGAGVTAVLEVARMVAAAAPFRNDVIFLLSDAEEQGLIGAHAFATLHPLFDRVRAVIDLEARGVTGPSVMFETADRNRGIIRLLANSLERPVANSLTYEMYRRMPNDTDFSVYRGYRLTGVNFAFVEGVAAYHSARDDLDRLDRASLQHHGQNAWSMLRALDERTLDKLVSSEDAVYVDLLGRHLLHYPDSTAAGLALVIGVLVLIAIRRSYGRQIRVRQVFWTLVVVVAICAALPAAGWLLSWPLGRWPDLHPLDHPWPWAGRGALFFTAVVVLYRAVGWLASRASTGSAMLTCWGLYVLLALILATVLPAASFVPLLPLLAFMIGLALDGFRWRRRPRLLFSSLFGFIAAAYVGFYLAHMLETVAGLDRSAVRIVPLVLPGIAALPLLLWYVDRHGVARRLAWAAAVLVLAGCIVQWVLPAYTVDRPRAMTLQYRQNAGERAAWLVLQSPFGKVDDRYAARHGFQPVDFAGWSRTASAALARPADVLELPDIDARARRVGEGERAPQAGRYLLDLRVPDGVRQLVLAPSEDAVLQYAAVDGQVMFDAGRPAHRPGHPGALTLHAPPPGPLRIELELVAAPDAAAALDLYARFDLPAAVLQPYLADWPADAAMAFAGPRATVRYTLVLAGGPAGITGSAR